VQNCYQGECVLMKLSALDRVRVIEVETRRRVQGAALGHKYPSFRLWLKSREPDATGSSSPAKCELNFRLHPRQALRNCRASQVQKHSCAQHQKQGGVELRSLREGLLMAEFCLFFSLPAAWSSIDRNLPQAVISRRGMHQPHLTILLFAAGHHCH